jgi:tetratricopeptide (TPR) repeat protein
MDFDRVVRIRVATGRRGIWVHGSGYLVAGERVLTAKHVLASESRSPGLGDPCQVRRWPCGATEDWLTGRVLWLHPSDDAAVLVVDGLGTGLQPVPWGRLEGSDQVEWTAMGYPDAGLAKADRREEQVRGSLEPGTGSSDDTLGLTVTSREPRDGDARTTGWAGLSGAAVLCGPTLIGLVEAYPAHWTGSLVGKRITSVLTDPGLAAAVGTTAELVPVRGRADSTPVPVPPPAADADEGLPVVGQRIAASVDHWRDRDDLRKELANTLLGDDDGARILSVTGRRGIGKSATVAKVVAEVEPSATNPAGTLDGVVYASPRTGVGELTVAGIFDALTRLLPQREAQDRRKDWDKAGMDALPGLWAALRNRRCVVVLDNLDDLQDQTTGAITDDELVVFLESVARTPYRQRVVTTSPRKPQLPRDAKAAVREFPLKDGLRPDDAVSLLRWQLRENPRFRSYGDEKLRHMAKAVLGVPRAIELVAELLGTAGPLTVDTLLESDAPLDRRMSDLVSKAFEHLNDAERRVVELLALATVPLPDREVPTMLHDLLPEDVADAAVGTLLASGEVGLDADAGLRLHPFDSDWVRTDLLAREPGMQIQLDLRLADWYASRRTAPSTWRSLPDVLPHRLEYTHRWRAGDRVGALRVLAEAANFLTRKADSAVLVRAVKAGDAVIADGEAKVYLERCRFSIEFYTGSLDRAQAALTAARAAADGAGLQDVVNGLDVDLGTLQRHRGDCTGAVTTLRALLDRTSAVEQRHLYLQALVELGLTLCYLRDWAAADDVAHRMQAVVLPGDDAYPAGPYDIWALVRMATGDDDGALTAADRGIALYLDSPRQDNAGYLYNVKALVHLGRDDLGAAESDLRQGLELATNARIDRLEGMCATNLAWTLLRAGRRAEAVDAARLADDRLTSIGVREAGTARALAELAAGAAVTRDEAVARLGEAVEASRANTDFYTPRPPVTAALAAALAGTPEVVAATP